jgi:hypothetical protein
MGRIRGIRDFGWALPAAAVAASVAVQVLRRPELFCRPQFFAEDGTFYENAHNLAPFLALTLSSNGYLQLLPRIVAAVAACGPLSWGPGVMLGVGAVICALPPTFILSRRLAEAVPCLRGRLVLAALYVAMPGVGATATILTYSQWYLALLAFMVLLATPPKSEAGRAAEAAVILLSGLSGPYCLALAPVAVVHAVQSRRRRDALNAAIVCATAVLQFLTILIIGLRERPMAPHGASVFLFLRILGGRVFYGATVGEHLQAVTLPAWEQSFGNPNFIACVGVAGLLLMAVAFVLGTYELRMFLAYGGALFGAILLSASVPPEGPPQWVALCNQGVLTTYFIIPTAAVYAACVWMIAQRRLPLRAAGFAVLAVALALGIPNDWRVPPVEDYDFPSAVRWFEAAPPGSRVRIAIPPGSSAILLFKPFTKSR